MAKQRSGTVIIERGGGSSLWWFLVGGALGAGLALLFAPQSGDRTRRMLGRKLGKLRDAADAALEDLQDSLSPMERVDRSLAEENQGDEGRKEAPESATGEERGTEDPQDASENGPPPRRVGSARQELEQRLANARARRQRALVDEDEEPVA